MEKRIGRWNTLLRNGQIIFLEELYRANAKRIADWAYRHLGDYEQAKDIVQDSFLIAVVKIDDVMASDNPKRWLYKTARNLIGHAIRERNKKLHIANSDISELDHDLELGLSEIFPKTFSTCDKKILHMYYYERCTIKEISDILGISISACKMRLLRLRKELRKIL